MQVQLYGGWVVQPPRSKEEELKKYLLRMRINAAVLFVVVVVVLQLLNEAATGGGGTRGSGIVDLREDRVRMEERRNNKKGRASECSMNIKDSKGLKYFF